MWPIANVCKTNKFIKILFSESRTSCELAHEHSGQWTEGGWGGWGVLVTGSPVAETERDHHLSPFVN